MWKLGEDSSKEFAEIFAKCSAKISECNLLLCTAVGSPPNEDNTFCTHKLFYENVFLTSSKFIIQCHKICQQWLTGIFLTYHRHDSGFGFRIVGGTEEGSQVNTEVNWTELKNE